MKDALTDASWDLLAYLQRRVGAEDAPDMLSETMLVAWRRVEDLPEAPEEARMWLFGIARGTLQNYQRGIRRRWALLDAIRGQLAANTSSPASDSGLEVRDAINRLGEQHAEIIRLVHWDGLTLAEAAVILDIPASTARTRYQRAKESLRRSLIASGQTSR